ncbi:gamma-hordein-3-like [Portunus trituberculatus]|uniref:gamma-hordein-3-like n=1 Tax=Portunus trituberculatus TaxID=210409 RepID=UPI001E1D04B7|nr:gamma-hordein-3-like [Portunus trituberculatus]
MKELLAVLVVVVAATSGAPQYNQASYSVGRQKFVRDEYGQYHPVSGPPVGPPFGVPFVQGHPSHGSASLIHQQQPFPSHQQQFPSHQQQFPSHQQQFPSHQQQFPSHQQQFPTHQNQQFPSNSGGGDVPFIPVPPDPNPGKPSVTPGVNTQLGGGFDVSAFARTKVDKKDKRTESS